MMASISATAFDGVTRSLVGFVRILIVVDVPFSDSCPRAPSGDARGPRVRAPRTIPRCASFAAWETYAGVTRNLRSWGCRVDALWGHSWGGGSGVCAVAGKWLWIGSRADMRRAGEERGVPLECRSDVMQRRTNVFVERTDSGATRTDLGVPVMESEVRRTDSRATRKHRRASRSD